MRKQTHWLCAALILAFAACTAAQEYTSRQEVQQNEALRQDFNIQGEYLAKDDDLNLGVQLIADGGGKFRVAAYSGGLPGDGWKTGDGRFLGTAEVKGDEITVNITQKSGTFPDGFTFELPLEVKAKVTIETPQGGGQGRARGVPVKIEFDGGTYVKQYRTSPTMGLAAPASAVVLFDGTNVDKWEADAKINEAPPRQGGGPVRPGDSRPGTGNTLWAEATAKPFEKKPYTMHLEFMTSYMPQARGQQRSNSGVYIDERYECQILDSFGLSPNNDECGGIYTVAAPAVLMSYPPLTWQTYDIEFTPARWEGNRKIANARVTVKHNGVLIHDHIELRKETPGRKVEGPAPLGVYLQGHGNKVQFRNIWIQYKDWTEPVALVEGALQSVEERPTRRTRDSGITVQQPVVTETTITTVVEAPDAARPVVTVVSPASAAPLVEVPLRRAPQPAPRQPLFPRLRAVLP
jgi:hypothetical protein